MQAVSRDGHLVGLGTNVYGAGHPFKGPWNAKWAADGTGMLQVWCDAGGCGTPNIDIVKMRYRLPSFVSHTGGTEGQTQLEACVCPPGTFGNVSEYLQDELRPTCYYAEEGFYSPGLPFLTEPLACPEGNWSFRGASSCTCGYNTMYDHGTGSCVPCGAGHHRMDLHREECEPCPLGFYKPEGEEMCIPAPVETFANETGMVVPHDCPPFSITLLAGKSIDDCRCKPGYYETAGDGETARCEPCNVGFAQPLRDRTSCEICQAGTYTLLPGQAQCLPCELGFKCTGWIGRSRCTVVDVVNDNRTLSSEQKSVGVVQDYVTGEAIPQPTGSADRRWIAANPDRYGPYTVRTYQSFASSGETDRILLSAGVPTPLGAYWGKSWDRIFDRYSRTPCRALLLCLLCRPPRSLPCPPALFFPSTPRQASATNSAALTGGATRAETAITCHAPATVLSG